MIIVGRRRPCGFWPALIREIEVFYGVSLTELDIKSMLFLLF